MIEANAKEDPFYLRPKGQVLVIFTIFEPPFESPDHYVVRRFEVRAGETRWTPLFRKGQTLDEVRSLVPPGLACMTRDPTDAPHIIESWL